MTSSSDLSAIRPTRWEPTDVGELVSALPLLLGFRPVRSVVLATDGGVAPSQLGAIVRVDLPSGPGHIHPLIAQLRQALTNAGATEATIAVIDALDHQSSADSSADSTTDSTAESAVESTADSDFLPRRFFVHRLTQELRSAGIQVWHAVWASATVSGARWRCYDACRCGGTVQDVRSSPLGAALILNGDTTFDSRDQLVAMLTADPADQLRRRAEMLETGDPASDLVSGAVTGAEAAYQRVRHAIAVAAQSVDLPVLDDRQIVELARALSNPEVRDRCLAEAVSAPAEEMAAAERLWTVLTRATPTPYRAQPACLLAVYAYLRGQGALAHIALDHAVNADPRHALASLLQRALNLGMPPVDMALLLLAALPPTDSTPTESTPTESTPSGQSREMTLGRAA